ncbi:hypothetical protein BJX63DRAFT_19875 [Aspergillus granulosus]|uniref:Uncharacterized protein n=1 Tax=Aspergillus granulosus TaxID=176169 RepID=A0ABR4H008_9EURO
MSWSVFLISSDALSMLVLLVSLLSDTGIDCRQMQLESLNPPRRGAGWPLHCQYDNAWSLIAMRMVPPIGSGCSLKEAAGDPTPSTRVTRPCTPRESNVASFYAFSADSYPGIRNPRGSPNGGEGREEIIPRKMAVSLSYNCLGLRSDALRECSTDLDPGPQYGPLPSFGAPHNG